MFKTGVSRLCVFVCSVFKYTVPLQSVTNPPSVKVGAVSPNPSDSTTGLEQHVQVSYSYSTALLGYAMCLVTGSNH